MLIYLLLILAALIAVVLIRAAMLPDTFRIDRSIFINASSVRIMEILGDLRRGGEWSPWEQKDPNMKRTYSGAASGVGSVYEWDGNRQIGKGRMEMVEVTPLKIVCKLDFIAPFKANNMAEFSLLPRDGGTELTWSMYGPQPFMGKVINTVMNCRRMVSREFDKGLAALKGLAEK